MDREKSSQLKPTAVRRLFEYHSCEEEGGGGSGVRPWLNTSDSDTSQSDSNVKSPAPPLRTQRGYCSDSSPCKHLPPIGVFWDIENCQIPRGRSAVAVAQAIRDKFFDGYREAEFLVVCDVTKETPQVVQELNDAQVNLIHVGSQSKNAADEKLRHSIRRFADLHGSLAAIVLISGDINFAPDLTDLRHRKKIHVFLVHNDMCSESLMLSANECYRYSDLVGSLPLRGTLKSVYNPAEVTVSALPITSDPAKVRQKLKRLAENCGGRVGVVLGDLATIRFSSLETAARAQKRMDGERVFGSQITVSDPIVVPKDMSPSKVFHRRSNTRKEEEKNYYQFKERIDLSCNPTWNNLAPPSTSPQTKFYGGRILNPRMPFVNQENVPFSFFGLPWNNTCNFPAPPRVKPIQSSVGRPILGRRNEPNHLHEPRIVQGNSNGRHSVDSLLDGRVDNKSTRTPYFPDNWVSSNSQEPRRCHTPSPPGVNTSIPPPPIVNLPRKENQYLFHPIPQAGSVELLVTNLDQSIEITEMKRLLTQSFSHYCSVLGVSVFVQADGTLAASVRVSSQLDSQKALTCLQRHKIGLTQIYVTQSLAQQQTTRDHTPSPTSSTEPVSTESLCPLHSREVRADAELTCVSVRLSQFSDRLKALVFSHENRLPLSSLLDCYSAGYERLNENNVEGVPLEHLVTCVRGVKLCKTASGKYLRLTQPAELPTDGQEDLKGETTAGGLGQIGSELEELLRSRPGSRALFTRLVPAYRQHFGQHCRVSHYGFNKLIHLLESLPSVVQVMGEGESRVVTLAHAAQMRHFTQDLLRVLRSQPPVNRLLRLKDLPELWKLCMDKVLTPSDYGLCHIEDLLSLLPSGVVTMTGKGEEKSLAIHQPQTSQEKERTKEFASQVVELLSKTPYFSLELSKFAPAYHQHFHTQCRVADYGFTKLVELLEAIPHVVQVEGEADGRHVTLTLAERLKVLGSQVCGLIRPRYPPGLALQSLNSAYLWEYGVALKPASYECHSLVELLYKLPTVKVVSSADGTKLVTPVLRSPEDTLRLCALRVLWERSSGRMPLVEFLAVYLRYFNHPCSQLSLTTQLKSVLTVTGDGFVQLTSLQLFARDVYRLLCDNDGRLPLTGFEQVFREWVGTALSPQQYGFGSTLALLQAIPHVVSLHGRGTKRLLGLNQELAEVGISLPKESTKITQHSTSIQPSSESMTGIPPAQQLLIGLKSKTAETQEQVTLLSPAEFLLPPSTLTFLPPSPDPSTLPKPGNFNLVHQQSLVKELGHGELSPFVEDVDLNDHNKRKLRLAAFFHSPIQLK